MYGVHGLSRFFYIIVKIEPADNPEGQTWFFQRPVFSKSEYVYGALASPVFYMIVKIESADNTQGQTRFVQAR